MGTEELSRVLGWVFEASFRRPWLWSAVRRPLGVLVWFFDKMEERGYNHRYKGGGT